MTKQYGSEPVPQNINDKETLKKLMSRRGFIGLAAAGVGSIGLVGCSSGESQSPGVAGAEDVKPEKEENDHSLSAQEVEVNLDTLVMPNLYEDRPWADPEQLVDLTEEELREIASMPNNEETRTDEGFARVFREKLDLMANAGRTLTDVRRAREMGIPVGEKDGMGNYLGEFRDYIRSRYADIMFEALFSNSYIDPEFTNVRDSLKGFLVNTATTYVYALDDPRWRDGGIMAEVDVNSVESLEPIISERRLDLGLVYTRPNVDKRKDDFVHDGKIMLHVEEGSNRKLGLAAHYVRLSKREAA